MSSSSPSFSHSFPTIILLTYRQERPAVVSVNTEASVVDVLAKLAVSHLHRVYVVDGVHHPVGVVSLKDLLKFVLDASED